MSGEIYVIGERSSVEVPDLGLKISGSLPLVICIGIPNPTPFEIIGIQHGFIAHNFGANEHTAWMTLHFHLAGRLRFTGEVFHAASKCVEEYSDDKLAKLREDLPDGIGLACIMILVNSVDQRIVAQRMYSWSNEMSLAFVDAAEKTRHASIAEADEAVVKLMKFSTDELADLATVRFELKTTADLERVTADFLRIMSPNTRTN